MIRRPPRSTPFPTRRSSDLIALYGAGAEQQSGLRPVMRVSSEIDRKSTRLNSSHTVISYAVFCLKKKKKEERTSEHDADEREHDAEKACYRPVAASERCYFS